MEKQSSMEQCGDVVVTKELNTVDFQSIVERVLTQIFQPLVELETIKRKITLSGKDVEKLYDIPESTLRTWRNKKRGPNFHQSAKGCPVIYTHEDIQNYLRLHLKGN